MGIAEIIQAARLKLGLSQAELARRVGVSKTAVSKWEDGSTAPNRNRAQAVARILGIPDDRLSSLAHVSVEVIDGGHSGHMIPIMDWEQLSLLSDDQSPNNLAYLPCILADVIPADEGVAVRVADDGMLGVISIGDVIIISRSATPSAGDIVVALAGNDIVLRRYQPRGLDRSGGLAFDLTSTNPDVSTRTVNSANSGRVIGVVIEHRRRLRAG